MQAVFQCPKGDTSLFYYVSKLNVFNFTIYELHSKDVECYVWDEATANRGVNDLGTCVFKYLQNLAQNNSTVDVIFYTDNCVGQQKIKMMLSMYMFAVQHYPNIKTITHKYLIKGHTQNEVTLHIPSLKGRLKSKSEVVQYTPLRPLLVQSKLLDQTLHLSG